MRAIKGLTLILTFLVILAGRSFAGQTATEEASTLPEDAGVLCFFIVNKTYLDYRRDILQFEPALPRRIVSIDDFPQLFNVRFLSADGKLRIISLEETPYIEYAFHWVESGAYSRCTLKAKSASSVLLWNDAAIFGWHPLFVYEMTASMTALVLAAPIGKQPDEQELARTVRCSRFITTEVTDNFEVNKLIYTASNNNSGTPQVIYSTDDAKDLSPPVFTIARHRWTRFEYDDVKNILAPALTESLNRRGKRAINWNDYPLAYTDRRPEIRSEYYFFPPEEELRSYMIYTSSRGDEKAYERLEVEDVVAAVTEWDAVVMGVFKLSNGCWQVFLFEGLDYSKAGNAALLD